MAFPDFAKKQAIKVFDTGEDVAAASLSFTARTELKHVRILLYKHGSGFAGTETLQLDIYSDSARTKLLYSSVPLDLVDIDNPDISTTTNWLGRVRFTFDPPVNINPNITYYVNIGISGYTRNGDTYFIGLGADSLGSEPVNNVAALNPGPLLECYGVR